MSEPKVVGWAFATGRVRNGRMPRWLLVINPDGSMTTLYDDSLVGLGEIQEVTRASHVEWSDGGDRSKGWYVVLSDDPRNGAYAGLLIGCGFKTRAEALAHEVQWLQENILK